MIRKVIQLAGKTLVVSLPSVWAKQHNVVKGADVEVIGDANKLCIIPSSVQIPKKTISIDVRAYDSSTIKSVLSVLHKSGYDEMELFYSAGQQAVVQERLKTNLLGFEIVQQSKQRMVVQNVTGDADESFEVLMRRVFLVTLELAKGVEEALREKEANKAVSELLSLEETNNKLTNYCHRILNKNPTVKNNFIYTIIWLQEKIADDYKEIINIIEKNKINRMRSKTNTFVQKTAYEILQCIQEFYDVVYSKDMQQIALTRERVKAITVDSKDNISIVFSSIRQHLLDGFGSLTALVFVQE